MKMNIVKRIITSLTICAMIITASPWIAPNQGQASAYSAITSAQAISWVQSQQGKGIDYDGCYGCQCVDLIKAYYKAIGVTAVKGNGTDYSWNALPTGWKRVQGGQPQKGDILVYSGNKKNPYGHVAIYESDYVTYHQNYCGHGYVEKVTNVKFNGFANAYWGYIRPDWKAPAQTSTSKSTTTTTSKNPLSSMSCSNLTSVSGNNVLLKMQFKNPNRIAVRTVGVQIKNSSGGLVVDHSESCYRNESRFQVFYDGPELGYKFKHNASYKFRFFIKHEGKRYYTSWKTVTTH